MSKELNQEEALKLLGDLGAIITDSHIVYTSGKHGSCYINKDAVYPYTRILDQICHKIADQFWGEDVDVVAGATIGGVTLSNRVASMIYPYEHQSQVLAVYAEENDDGSRIFKRGYNKLIPGKRVSIVEDVLTTGGTVKKLVKAVRDLNGEVIGVGAICNRGGVKAEDLGVDNLFSVINIKMDAYSEDSCPLCQNRIPFNMDVGKTRQFKKRLKSEGRFEKYAEMFP